jgi:hypothetical protein
VAASRRFEPFNRTGFRSRALFAGRPAKGILYGNFNHISVRSFIPTGAPFFSIALADAFGLLQRSAG